MDLLSETIETLSIQLSLAILATQQEASEWVEGRHGVCGCYCCGIRGSGDKEVEFVVADIEGAIVGCRRGAA